MAKPDTNKKNLTQAAVKKLPTPEKNRVYYYDTKLAGFGVCCYPSGAKTFILYRKIEGRPVRLKLGKLGDVTANEARQEARKLAGEIVNGGNPAEARREARQEMTLADLWPLYLEKYAKVRKRTWEEDQRQWKAYLSPLKNRRLSKITRANVRDWHARQGKKHGHYQANRSLALLSGLFAFARDEGFEGKNPCQGLKRFKETSRERFLSADELSALAKSLDAEPALWKDFFRVLLLTGARVANVRAMRWDELELKRGLWRIPGEKFKTGEPMVIILSPPVVDILKARLSEAESEAAKDPDKPVREWVFPARYRTMPGPIFYPQNTWKRIVKRAGLKDLHIHDLRRSMASWAVGAGASLYAVGKALGHRDAATTQIYARLDLAPQRAAIEQATTAMLPYLNGGADSTQDADGLAEVTALWPKLPADVRGRILALARDGQEKDLQSGTRPE